MKPSIYWRNALRSAMPRAPAGEQEFVEYCAKAYADEKRTLEERTAGGASDFEISSARMGVYIFALTLLTYGRLEVIGDILENMPPRLHPTNRGLSPAVDQLIPVAGGFHAGVSPQEVLAWIRANESRLRWDEEAGRFVLE